MKLTKNEKQTLKLLLGNSKINDSEIASRLNISSQAVGKIRRKLESTLIDSYTVKLNFAKLGIQAFAVAIAKLTKGGLDKGVLEVEQKLLNNPHLINVYRVPKGSSTHILVYGFKDLNELDEFFHSTKAKEELHKYIETQDLFTFSHNSLIKNDPLLLFHKVIDSIGTKASEIKFNELELFKKKLK